MRILLVIVIIIVARALIRGAMILLNLQKKLEPKKHTITVARS